MGDAQETFSAEETGFMARAIELAHCADGQTAPNPAVGCVLVKDGAVIAEGWHKGPGLAHAEAMALALAGEAAAGATAYVTLEPCNHTGRTGPCAQALIDSGVTNVVYALADPNPVAAGGASQLRQAGIIVRSGLLKNDAKELVRPWLSAVTRQKPYIWSKSAMSLDGRIATATGESQWITAPPSRAAGHRLRRRADAIIIGAETVITDDPTLTARNGDDVRAPLRIVLDSTARTSPGAKAYERSGNGALLVTTDRAPANRLAAFREHGIDIVILPKDENGRPDITYLVDVLFERDLHALMIEGGGSILGAFYDADLLDEIHLFIAPKIIGGGRTSFGGDGVAQLSDTDRYEFVSLDHEGPDQYFRGRKKELC